MKKPVPFVMAHALCLAFVLVLSGPAASEPAEAERVAGSRKVVKSFAERLKGQLVGALKSAGPEAAIAVCNTVAPDIAKEKAAETGWSVGRTALRLRNPANAPDAWERAVLEKFVRKAGQGADLAKLEHFETTTRDGKRVFRYMKAIPTQKPCLTCHGDAVKPDLRVTIKEFYPDDQATGFKLGELRGAFTIVQPVE